LRNDRFGFASLIWLDDDFNLIEKKTYSDLTYHFWVQDLINLGEDGFVASGTYRTPEWSQEHSVIKIDKEGNLEWSFRLPPPYASGATSLAMTDDGNFIVSYPLFDFSISDYYDRPYTIQKVTPDGEVLWRHIFLNLGPQTIAEFIIAENGEIVGVGQDEVDDGQFFVPHGFLFRMTQDGELLWKKAIADYRFGFPSNRFNNLLELSNGDLVMTGSIVDPTVSAEWVAVVPDGELAGNSRWTISIVDITGRIIDHQELDRFPYELSIADYSLGMYFVRLENEAREFQVLKMVKI